MFSKSLAVGALAAGCVAAAAGGAYLAVRHNQPSAQTSLQPAESAQATTGAQPAETPRPVAETEAVVTAPASSAAPAAPAPPDRRESIAAERPVAERSNAPSPVAKPARTTSRVEPVRQPRTEAPVSHEPVREPAAVPPPAREPAVESPTATAASVPVEAATPPVPQLEQIVVPASSVVGLRVETSLSTERAQPEDRVDARVTRDVIADGRVAIPEGARAIGTVMLVERGGKIKEKARLGVRFHTLVLADGRELPIATEAIYREGDSPSGESTRKIGGAAVGGAILGAIIGGKKGALIGGATGAAGGTAAVMVGDRNAATLPAGTIVTVRLAAPVGVEVEKR